MEAHQSEHMSDKSFSLGEERGKERGGVGDIMEMSTTTENGVGGSRNTSGEKTYKKTTSSALKGAIHEGSNLTPAHHYPDFRFKTYAPLAFRYFRELFGIKPDDYLYSICNEPLIELSNPGASGSLFYLTSDDEFIIKTNLNQNPRTLLPKFYGLYCIQSGGVNIRLVVMNNVLPRSVKMHYKYDLKGSTYKRRASRKEREKACPVYKDLDFQDMHEGLYFDAETYNALMKTLQRDCRVGVDSDRCVSLFIRLSVRLSSRAQAPTLWWGLAKLCYNTIMLINHVVSCCVLQVLESFKIMDYSLLLAVHVLDQSPKEGGEPGQAGGDGKRPVAQRVLYSTAMESIQGDGKAAEAHTTDDTMGGIPAKSHKEEKLLIFLGIIDILQSYRFIKKLEHSWKALVYDGDSVSVHRPGFYANRFLKFMSTSVFRKTQTIRFSPSKRTRTSIPALKSSSQEILSSQKEENEEERRDRLGGARSLASLDGQVFGSYLCPDLVPATPSSYEGSSMGTISSSSIFVNLETKSEDSSTFTLEDSAICLTSEQSTMDVE
ncbi:unnamed protein product, partial [Coregonus sp. 'balchen']